MSLNQSFISDYIYTFSVPPRKAHVKPSDHYEKISRIFIKSVRAQENSGKAEE